MANKADKLKASQKDTAVEVLREGLGTGAFLLFSAQTGEGRDSLRAALQRALE